MDRCGGFPSTHWTVLLDHSSDAETTQQILEKLCARYWYPLYAYLRRKGYSSPDAQDLTQGYLYTLLRRDGLSNVDRERGKFRSYLLGGLNHYLSDVRKHNQAAKRGGGLTPLSIEKERAEARFENEPADHLTPEKLYDREWALTLLQGVVDDLRTEYVAKDKESIFDAFRDYLTAETDRGAYARIAKTLSVTEANARTMAKRIRERYRGLLRERIAETVDSVDSVNDELRYLLAAF